VIPAPGTPSAEANVTLAIFLRGASPRGLLTSTTYLGLGLEAAQPKRAVKEMKKTAKGSIRKPSAICTL